MWKSAIHLLNLRSVDDNHQFKIEIKTRNKKWNKHKYLKADMQANLNDKYLTQDIPPR